jgi:hypothetical protein
MKILRATLVLALLFALPVSSALAMPTRDSMVEFVLDTIFWGEDSGNVYLKDSYGAVGIGTAIPLSKLHVKSGPGLGTASRVEADGDSTIILVSDSDGDFGGRYMSQFLMSEEEGNLYFRTGDPIQVRMTITQDGYIGVGTTSPGEKLDVNGDIIASGTICDSTGCIGGGGGDLTGSGTTGYITKWTGATNLGNSSVIFDSGSKIGIGTESPDYKLDVSGNLRVDSKLIGPDDTALTLQAADGRAIIFNTDGAVERMRITNDGKVGIKTDSPEAPLHVEASNSSDQGVLYVRNTREEDPVRGIYSEVNSAGSNSIGVFGISSHPEPDPLGGTFGVLGRVSRIRGTGGHSSAGIFGDAVGPDSDGDGLPGPFDSLAMGVQGETWSTNASAAGGKFIAAQGSGEAKALIAFAESPDSTGLQIIGRGRLIEARKCIDAGDGPCSGSDVVFKVTNAGNVQADGSYTSPATDLAEYVPIWGLAEPGDVIMIDVRAPNRFKKSDTAGSTLVAGIVSTKPGVILGLGVGELPDQMVALALAGRVPVKVSNENGQIQVGDWLIAASKPGYAMKCIDKTQCIGQVIGKALEPMNKKNGLIEALVTLH